MLSVSELDSEDSCGSKSVAVMIMTRMVFPIVVALWLRSESARCQRVLQAWVCIMKHVITGQGKNRVKGSRKKKQIFKVEPRIWDG